MTHKKHGSKKQLERERCLRLARRHTVYCFVVITSCIGVAYYGDTHIATVSKVVAEITGGAAAYWWLFGYLEQL